MTSSTPPPPTRPPQVSSASPTNRSTPLGPGKLMAWGTLMVELIVAQVAMALGNIDVLGQHPLGFLTQWGQDLQQQASEAYAKSVNAEYIAGVAQATASGLAAMLEGIAPGSGAVVTYIETLIAGIPGVGPIIVTIIEALGGIGSGLTGLKQALQNIPGANIVGQLLASVIPALDASKITSGILSLAQLPASILTTASSIAASAISGLLSAANIPTLDASKIASGVISLAQLPANLLTTASSIAASAISGLLSAANIPSIDASKITSGIVALAQLPATILTTASNIAASAINGLLSAANIPVIDASKIGSGILDKFRFPDITRDMSSDLQGSIDAGINALRNTPGTVGQAFHDWEDALAALPTQIFNKFGGNSVARASQAQANAAMQTLQSTINAHTAAISALQTLLDSAGGFSASVMFRQPETTQYSPGAFTHVLPGWFTLGVDTLDGIQVGAGGGAQGATFGVPAGLGSDGAPTTTVVNGVTHTAAGGAGNSNLVRTGVGPGPTTYLDILYPGGADQPTDGAPGNTPGGGGAGQTVFAGISHGGGAASWDTFSVVPTSPTITGVVAAAAAGGTGTNPGGAGAPGSLWLRARPAMPAAFTSMGTLILPTFKLNTGVAQTDAMTAAASWSRVPPGGASGGHIIIIRANATYTSYVYLRVWVVSGVTYYALGRVSLGVVATPWKTGTIAEAIPFNAFSLTSDDAWTFTIGINGTAFDSYTDAAHASAMGASNRSGGWASSDAALPGSIVQFAFLDTGTPSRIVSATVATAQGTTSTAAYVDLATTGPSVTLNVPASGEVVIDVSARLQVGGLTQTGFMGFVLSGANTLAADDTRAAILFNPTAAQLGTLTRRFHLTGLTPGTTTFKAVYKTSAGTSTFSNRNIIVEPKP